MPIYRYDLDSPPVTITKNGTIYTGNIFGGKIHFSYADDWRSFREIQEDELQPSAALDEYINSLRVRE